MPTAPTAYVKYLYLDIVGFTKDRNADIQYELITTLNDIVRLAIQETTNLSIKDNNSMILLPTGDGMCIALVNFTDQYDVHIQIALRIIEQIHRYNQTAPSKKHELAVRIGINEGQDFLIKDINDRANVAGNGVNMAQRIVAAADGGNILVSNSVYGILVSRAQYEEHFSNSLVIKIKHSGTLTVYQYRDKKHPGLKNTIPSSVKTPRSLELSEQPFKRGMVIHSASYGVDDSFIDVSEHLQKKASSASIKNKFQMKVRNSALGIRPGEDPSPGIEKDLTVVYSFGGKRITKKVHEYETLELP